MRLAAIAVLLIALACCGCGGAGRATEGGGARVHRAAVAYAVDGDTLRVRLPSGRLAYVRLVGIDTPEDVRFGNAN